MKVFIYAYEDKYGGLHGIYDQTVVEVADMKEANMIGNDMSWGVIDSWGLSQDYDEDYEDEEFEVEYGTEWIIYKIRDDVTLSIEELDELCSHEDYKNFVKMYCEEEALVE